MTEEEALENVSELLSAFANDLNDGDGPVLYEGGDVAFSKLRYTAVLEDGTQHEFVWNVDLVEHWKNGVRQDED